MLGSRVGKVAVLSLALAVSAVSFIGGGSVQVEAAAQDAAVCFANHDHNFNERQNPPGPEYCEEANSVYHFVYQDVEYKCGICGAVSTFKEQVGYEEHNFARVPNASYILRCVDCGYEE